MSNLGSVPINHTANPAAKPHRDLFKNKGPEQTVSCSTQQLNSLKTARKLSQDLVRWMRWQTESDQPESDSVQTLKLDLGGVDRLSSVGVNELIEINRKARKLGVKLILTEVGEAVQEVFAVTRLERMFHVVESDSGENRSLDPA
ncbi:STAS domain-containing protein [Novipirellula rosea]|uniref:STAS domain-containing protein n=1 Tax=Novipirellula rosea TaxID=1031540 RepID=A0ABP8N1Z3_9BACT|tara:strand:+ start:13304 stop:13738 length:435 start_codon:yes stop_codon:yes gene_type:complete